MLGLLLEALIDPEAPSLILEGDPVHPGHLDINVKVLPPDILPLIVTTERPQNHLHVDTPHIQGDHQKLGGEPHLHRERDEIHMDSRPGIIPQLQQSVAGFLARQELIYLLYRRPHMIHLLKT